MIKAYGCWSNHASSKRNKYKRMLFLCPGKNVIKRMLFLGPRKKDTTLNDWYGLQKRFILSCLFWNAWSASLTPSFSSQPDMWNMLFPRKSGWFTCHFSYINERTWIGWYCLHWCISQETMNDILCQGTRGDLLDGVLFRRSTQNV